VFLSEAVDQSDQKLGVIRVTQLDSIHDDDLPIDPLGPRVRRHRPSNERRLGYSMSAGNGKFFARQRHA
jgi:hypothetical protein